MNRILVIEDHPQMLRNLATILKMEGYAVTTAQSGLEGLKEASNATPDLILCDVNMPQVDGYETLRHVRASAALHSIPFIFITAKADRADQRVGMNLGADDYITKPFSREEVLGAIRCRLELSKKRKSEGEKPFQPTFTSAEPLAKKFGLTPREAEVLLWVAQGKSNADVGTILGMAEKTVKKHLTSVFEKLGVESRTAATISALEALSNRSLPPEIVSEN